MYAYMLLHMYTYMYMYVYTYSILSANPAKQILALPGLREQPKGSLQSSRNQTIIIVSSQK